MSASLHVQPLSLHPDRLLPADPGVRAVARELYAGVAAAAIVSPHGHVDPQLLVDDEPFANAAELLVVPDHYVTRLLHAHGVPLEHLGLADRTAPEGQVAAPREIWRRLCEHWQAFAGTPSRYWLESELVGLFGIDVRPSVDTSDLIYDAIAERLATPAFRPRALFTTFDIDVLATTDDPASDLRHHRRLADDPTFRGSVIPTFRPDAYLDPATPDWAERLAVLADITGEDTGSYAGFSSALRQRRAFFRDNGATATDHGPRDAGSEPLPDAEAERIHRAALSGDASPADTVAYRHNMLFQMAAMSADDGLVMQLHPGVARNHHRSTFERFGADTGHDLPTATEYVRALQPILQRFGTSDVFRTVLFTVDETTFSRDLAPLAGFYPSVFVGAPWWFLDTPKAILRFREAVTDSAGFLKTSGFIDDTRAFCSIPARHDMSRRIDASYLARLVAEQQLSGDEAHELLHDMTSALPRRVFRLPPAA